MPSCSVKWCSNHTSTCSLKSKNGVSFHRFPKDEETCQKWVEAVRHERRDPWWTSSNASRICSIHFKETDISSTPCKVNVLAKTAVPICTMVWYDENENNIPLITFNEKTKTVKPILKTYARKKTNMNVLKESKVNTSYNSKIEITTMSKINSNAISNMTPCQESVLQATKLLKTLEVSETQNLKEGLEKNSVANIDLNTSAKENLTEVKENTVLTELNKTDNIKSSKEKCFKSNILVKLNDNTNFILDEDLSNDDTKFTESNKLSEEPNMRTCENSMKSNENTEPPQVTNISNADMFVETLTNGNVELNANISKTYVGKMLKTYLPKRKEKTIKKTPKLKKNQSVWTITMDKGLNIIKCNEINNTSVKHIKDYFKNKLKTGEFHKNNINMDLQSNSNLQERTQFCALNNVKKYTFKKSCNLFNRQRIGEQNKSTFDVEPNIDVNKESNISYLDDFITNQSRIDKIKEIDTAVYDEIISELFETSKNVENVSNTPNNSNYKASNENVCIVSNTVLCTDNNIDSALAKGKNNTHVILDLDKNIYTELNTLMDTELYNVVNTGLNCETNTEINTDKTAINEIIQFNENIATESNLTTMNSNMPTVHSEYLISDPYYYLHVETNGNTAKDNQNMSCNENLTNNATILSNNELKNLETSVVKNIVPKTKKVEFNILKKYLTMNSKLDSPSELCTNVLTDAEKNIFSRYNNITSTSITKENLQVSDRDNKAEFNKNIDIEVNEMIAPLQNNINTSATIETESNFTSSKPLKSIFLEEFITNIAPESSNNENVDFIINSYTDPNTTKTKVSEFNGNNISDINVECTKILEKDMNDLDTVINMVSIREDRIGLNDEMSIGLNEEFNTVKTNINADPTQYNESTVTESDQPLSITIENMPIEHSDHLIPESEYYLHTGMIENITTEGNKNICYNENIINAIIVSNTDQSQILDTSVVNNIEAKKDKFTELRKHLSTKPKLNSLVDLCTNTLTDTDKNWFSKYSTMSTAIIKENIQLPDRRLNAEFDKNFDIEVNDVVTSLEHNMYIDANKETKPILLEELITNITPELNIENRNFINNLETNSNTTRPTLNKKMLLNINECNTILGKDIPELNTVILAELNEDQALKSKEVMHTKFDHLNTETYTDKDVILQKSKKDFVNVLPMPDDQHTVVNKHMDVVDSILNRDVAAEFDLSLLLSDTPIPDDEIQNVDNNSNNNSLDGIGGSPNWIPLPSGEMPKIIDDILDQGSPFFENLDLFDKANKFNMDKWANKKNNGTKKKCSTSNFEKFEEQIMNNYCETGKPCTKNSIAQIEKQLLDLENIHICNEKKVSQIKKVTAEKCYDICDKQTGKQILEEYLQLNDEQCEKFNLDQIVDKCFENCNKEIQGNKPITQCQKQNNVDSVENPSIDQYFEQSENPHRDHDEVLNDVDILELSKKQYEKQSNEQMYQEADGQLVTMEESIPKFNILSEGFLESSFQQINKELPDLNAKIIEEDNNVSNEAHTAGTERVRGLNIGKLKRVIFEECYDAECGNDCKYQKHNSNMESHKKDDQQYKKQTNNTSSQPDIDKRKRRFNVLYKQQRYQSSSVNLNKQLKDGSVDPKTNQKKKTKFLERSKLSHNEKCKTNYKKIAIDHIPGQYVELRWNECDGKFNTISQDGCKRKHKELGLDQRKMLCSESTNNFSQQIMECPECGYTTDDNDLINYKSDVDLRITKPLSLINKDMLISLRDTENNGNNKKVTLESVYAMELAYVTAIQALERKLKQKMAISEYRLRKVNNLSKINNQLTKASVTLMDISQKNKV